MDDVTFLSKTIISCDNNKNRMGRDDVVNLVMELSKNDNQKKCENHYDNLVRRKKINGMNRDCRVVAEQPTPINRSAITVSQQWRLY